MRTNRILLFFMLLLPTHLFAQTIDTSHTHALGLLVESNSMFARDGNAELATVGLQYNKRRKKLSYKLTAGYASYDQEPHGNGFNSIIQDTAIRKTPKTKIDMVMIGGGLEVQRQFYRKLYFFAGVELRAGYGSGTVDTTITKEYYVPLVNPYTGMAVAAIADASYGKTGTDATLFYLGITPYFGLKLEFKRFILGTDFKNYVAFTALHDRTGATGNVDFSSSNISQSFFVQYKF